ncbi:group III truncated hemoglobin [Sulfurimonas sp. SAG-AH-194-L11]|nr:group III truncated hemoglobin [Sulfurimonas sp. SAG-AH-194-L11]MDF1877808.1 group III truncated hemoglobin [Sulfurimonas sp. SAG-AH-194-L11]
MHKGQLYVFFDISLILSYNSQCKYSQIQQLLSFSNFATITFSKGYKLELQKSITRENLRTLMTVFYENAILDPDLGPFFIHELGSDMSDEDWIGHIDLLADFWLAELLGHKTYIGNFIGAHIKLPYIKNELFAIWINLFSNAADTIYTPELATMFKEKGRELSREFINNKPKTLTSSAIFQIKGKK